ncbi:geminin DNA replication inhibitor [Rhynchophorus ferrugineus]|uniref:geminin DNA replication inhibitor n=1 Tax=Rhynchophorus ferrugineus TaxID=354439 RepID=UPI003FCD8F4E
MMKTEQSKKVIIKVDSSLDQENVKNLRRTLKSLQPAATDKENLAGRAFIYKDSKVLAENENKKLKALLMHKGTQTEPYIGIVDDLTSEEASVDYWKRLAEKRQESLDVSLHEIEKLKDDIEALQEENKVCKEMLEESRHLVEVLQEVINETEGEGPSEQLSAEQDNLASNA